MSETKGILCLKLPSCDDAKVTVKIVSKQDRCFSHENKGVPDYVDLDSSENVPVVLNQKEMHYDSPIQILTQDPELPNVLLLEETLYEICFECNDTVKMEGCLSYFKDYKDEASLEKTHFGFVEGKREIYRIIFKSYVGRGFIDVTIDGNKISIPIESCCKKLDYLEDYPKMLEDITKFSASLVLYNKAPLYTEYGAKYVRGPDSLYEQFILLKYVMEDMDIMSMYQYVKNNRYSKLENATENVPIGYASDADPADILMNCRFDDMVEISGGLFNGFMPRIVSNRYCFRNEDIPENRLVKDLLFTLRNLIEGMLSVSRECNVSIHNRLMEYSKMVSAACYDVWLTGIGDLHGIPYESNVLRCRHGYMEILEAYIMLGLNVSLDDRIKTVLEGHNSKVYEAYELWCYIKLIQCLCQIQESNGGGIHPFIKDPELVGETREGWDRTVSLDPIVFTFPYDDCDFTVTLYNNKQFEREFRKKGQEFSFASYSIALRPDFTLLIKADSTLKDQTHIVNFDAKYKVKLSKEVELEKMDASCWQYDIYKMHTYRDALVRSLASFVLYPGMIGGGSSLETNYVKTRYENEWDMREDNVVPAVGSIVLSPSKDNTLDNLEDTIIHILNVIAEKDVLRID